MQPTVSSPGAVTGCPAGARPLLGCQSIDHDVCEAIVADKITNLAEWIAGCANRVARAGDPGDDLNVLARGDRSSVDHRVRSRELNGLRETTLESFDRQRRPRPGGVAHEHE